MSQLPLFELPLWSVTELTLYLRELLESDHNLQDLWIRGEVSNLSRPSSGHLYFTLKDSSSSLKCVMWRNLANRQSFTPRDGQAIEVHGSLNIYEAAGQYQLYADTIRPAGEGALYQEFLRLKARLETEGLFAAERKRPVPPWPNCIGIVTSPTGAALRDMLNTLRRRYPLVDVVLAPSPVQGSEAPAGIVTAIERLNRLAQPDVILVARGGGSIEDLWAFNDEGVARAIAASQAPVITGVGHETDFTIADFVSDLRAPTPTAAAELATPNRADLQLSLTEMAQRLAREILATLDTQRSQIRQIESRLAIHSPLVKVRSDRQRLDELGRRATLAIQNRLRIQHVRLAGLLNNLASLDPQSVLQRGFAAITHERGYPVRSVSQAQTGDTLYVHVVDGRFNVQVQNITPDKE